MLPKRCKLQHFKKSTLELRLVSTSNVGSIRLRIARLLAPAAILAGGLARNQDHQSKMLGPSTLTISSTLSTRTTARIWLICSPMELMLQLCLASFNARHFTLQHT